MNNLGFIEKLLDGVKVEWVRLGDVAFYVRGLTYSKSNESSNSEGFKVLRANNITLSGNVLNFDDIKIVTHDTKVKSSQKLYKNDILISAASGSREHVGKVAFIKEDLDYYFGGFMGVVRPHSNLLPGYMFHILTSAIFQRYMDEMLKSSTINNLSSSVMNGFECPIPCPDNPKKSLEIQAEIVRILDAFTAMTAELTAELNLRRQQYNYYRDQLLSFEEGEVEWKTLGEVAEYSKSRIRHTELDGSNYVGVESLLQNRAGKIDSTRTPDSGNLTKYKVGDILIGNIRPYLKKIWHADRVGGTNGDVLVVHPTDTAVNPKYLYQVLADDKFFEYNMQHAKGAKMPRGNKPKILEYLIPVPSLEEQARIVAILDKFDTLTTSLTEGLPREIELRQQQYEYYRDLLLSFPKPDTKVVA
ncbi:restriction endonuclease subunit S [Advenella alkanexedens]|uniref:Restriction endonuclease subunit S n=1 Tax=Advenella alkanexedens TaxID=1481665 RepID=A0ABS6NL41_9BURK|nr:restriction endonuclease subunit S [Advenella alkanexedens]MBV4396333.1 restriction endonuclease subunit S [Advenella alkanexedens]